LLVRPAEARDHAAIAALSGELGYPAEPAEIARRMDAVGGRPDQRVWVAESRSGVIAWIQASLTLALEAGPRVEIVGLVVGGSARRTGIGRLLVGAAEDWARAEGLHQVVVRSNEKRAESHPFYAALGYEKTKTQVVYRKSLPPKVL
jgi:GNAT superfamily N-acetyltransferase